MQGRRFEGKDDDGTGKKRFDNDRKILKTAIVDSFRKLDPRLQIKKP